MTIYAVCQSLQEEEIKEYCFKKCGKIIIGGLDFAGAAWFPCRSEVCPYCEKEESFGEVPIDDGSEELVARKLRPVNVMDVCPNCGSHLVIKDGRHGEFLACPRFPDCRYTRSVRQTEELYQPPNPGGSKTRRTW